MHIPSVWEASDRRTEPPHRPCAAGAGCVSLPMLIGFAAAIFSCIVLRALHHAHQPARLGRSITGASFTSSSHRRSSTSSSDLRDVTTGVARADRRPSPYPRATRISRNLVPPPASPAPSLSLRIHYINRSGALDNTSEQLPDQGTDISSMEGSKTKSLESNLLNFVRAPA